MKSERLPERSADVITIAIDGKDLEVPELTAATLWVQTCKRVFGARLVDLANSDTTGALGPEFTQDYTDLLTHLEENLAVGDKTWSPILAQREKEAIEASHGHDELLGLNHVKQLDMLVSEVKSAQDFLNESRERALLS